MDLKLINSEYIVAGSYPKQVPVTGLRTNTNQHFLTETQEIEDKIPIEQILKYRVDDIDRKTFNKLFGTRAIKTPNGMVFRPMYSPKFQITIPKGALNDNKEPIKTTIGRFIFNIFIIADLYNIIGYVNEPVTAGKYEDITDMVSKAVLNDKISTEQMADYLNRVQWLGFAFGSTITPSITEKTITPLPDVMKKKDELFKKYKKELDAGDATVGAKIEAELLDIAKKELQGDPGMDLYNSGSNASFKNNYKAMSVMKGPVSDINNGGYRVVKSNFMEGIKKDEIEVMANQMVVGAYSRGVGTQIGGYLTKQMFASYQSVVLDKENSDCGSIVTHTILLTKKNYKLFMYRYIIERGKLICLTDAIIKNYIGRSVKMRDIMYCIGDKPCSKCAGELYYKLGIQNIGLTTAKVSSSIMNKSLKKFHDTSIKVTTMNIDDYLE